MATFKKFTIVLIFSFLFNSAAFSQWQFYNQDDSSIYVYKLEEIVVYGQRNKINPSMVTELKLEDIQARNATTVTEVLKYDPGLSLTTGTKAETETKIRGFPSRDVLVLVDGRPINPGYYGKVDLSMLPLDNIAKIQVIKGPASVAYGANSMGGVISIITKNGLDIPRTVIETKFGDYQFRNLNINHSRKIGKINYWISGYENYSRGFKLSHDFTPTSLEDGGVRNNSFYHRAGFSGKVGFQPSAKGQFALSLSYNWAKKNIPTTIYSWDSPQYWKFPSWQRYSGSASWQWQLKPSVEMRSILYVDVYNDRLITYLNKEMRYDQIDYDSRLENWTAGGILDGKILYGNNHQFHGGLNFKRDLMNKKSDLDQPWHSHTTYTGSIFLQDDYKFWKRTEFTIGVNYNFFQSEAENSFSSRICPLISIKQEFWQQFQCYATYANTIRFPTLHHLYSETSGNPRLKPEQADKIEIGLQKFLLFDNQFRYGSIELIYFYNNLKNLIYRESKSYRYKNIARSKIQGGELRSIWSFNRYFAGEIGYGYTQVHGSSTELMEYIPTNKFRLQLNAKTGFGTNLNYEFGYFDERITFVTTKMLPAYFVHNINISQQITSHFKIRLELSNFTDTHFEEELGYPAPGANVIAGLSWTF